MTFPPPEERAAATLLGSAPSIRLLRADVVRASRLEVPVLIVGPTGSGKELAAQLLHDLSGRPGRMVAVNVAALPDQLAEAELFGVARGAFTGAVPRQGLIEHVDGGTLFLDEAGDLPLTLQAKLLRVLDSGRVRPVGALEERLRRFRLVVSTQEPPDRLVAAGRWRIDFMYRVTGITLQLPGLAERLEDIPELVAHFLVPHRQAAPPPDQLDCLRAHDWPGNIRELRRVVERALFLAAGAALDAGHFRSALDGRPREAARGVPPDGLTLNALTRRRVAEVLGRAPTRAAAASELGISVRTLYRWLRFDGAADATECQ